MPDEEEDTYLAVTPPKQRSRRGYLQRCDFRCVSLSCWAARMHVIWGGRYMHVI
jgi:hypothetical protein